MAPPAQAQLGFEPAEGPLDSKICDDGRDDWVSLILSDVGTDAEADNPVSIASLSSLPLPDLEDLDFSNLNGSFSSIGFSASFERGPPSHSDVLFDPSEILQDMEYHSHDKDSSSSGVHPCVLSHLDQSELLACPSFLHFPTLADQNADSQSPESGLSHVSPEHPDVDTNIPVMDSCSDEDSFYFLVSDVCSEDTSLSTEANHCSSESAMNAVAKGGSVEFSGGNRICDTHGNIDTLQVPSNQQILSTVFDKNDVSSSKRDTSRKRKYLDRSSRSTTPEGAKVDSLPKSLEEVEVKDEEDERRRARLMRNRESAQLSRQRKKIYVDELEEKIKTMASTIAELNNTISLISAENINLRRQLGMFGGQAGGISPWMGAYPPGPMVGNRVMVPGAHVPLVPIPRWKSQQATTVKKTRKPKAESKEKGDSEVAAKKTKKVAGVAAAGLFFFVFILLPFNFQFLGLRPMRQRDSKVWPTTPWHMETSNGVVRAGGRVLMGLNEEGNFSVDEQGSVIRGGEKVLQPGGDSQEREMCDTTTTDRGEQTPGYQRNASIPLAATLFVPRNDQLVRIEGNLIINSVLAGNKAAESVNQPNKRSVKSPALYNRNFALNANLKAVALKAAPEEQGALVELQRALAGRLKFDLDGVDLKPLKEDGSLQRWFVEDFTGPIFSSGMCTEVFQFETSPASSPPTPGSGSRVQDANDLVKNKTAWLQENVPRKAGRSVPYSGKSPSYAVPLPPVGHKVMFNATSTNSSFSGAKAGYAADDDFAKRKHASSSVVVSVLTGPELGEHSKLTGGHKLSRIFVVVLIDSIKYVTYSCMLPSTAAKPHYEVVVA
ncbi:hypothetical protein GOP47_0014687 [Adiantum capillus-veneris]|uniref:BZIP domain-containing protein n=1 Tax=Adiantum capillus-veneris TaxID=13818 RepID=A0A9D4ZCP6_ADICA|nr:hypothetical protein GOP47_0014687 [Adiantum capillus-veneris]